LTVFAKLGEVRNVLMHCFSL